MVKHLPLFLLLLLASCSNSNQDTSRTQPERKTETPIRSLRERVGQQIVLIAETRMKNIPGPKGLDLQNEQQRIQNYQWHSWEFALNTAREWAENSTEYDPPQMTYAQVVDRIDGCLSGQERQYLVLYGDIDAIREREGTCGVIMGWAQETGGYGNTLVAYIDTQSDELVFFWVAPCG